ncbi:MAG: GTPase/DUF3482 domain-containing protein [Myxococcota bacterium]
MTAPEFAVVGRVNKGKSSIIATLAENDQIAISPLPGTTRRCRRYPVIVDDETLFVLVDTPGFEDAASVLSWLKEAEVTADQREARVHAFVAAHQSSSDFVEECELLRPILEGALILYVVDGTKPYRENYQTEMEILRWTGRPSMALINRIGDEDHSSTWRRALDQYFKVVRDFDAHSASFSERMKLLSTFKELEPQLETNLARAIDALKQERERRRAEVVHIISRLLLECLTFTLEATDSERQQPHKLEQEFHEHLRKREEKARLEVETLYRHHHVNWQHAGELDRPIFGEDLFAKKTWRVLGLSPGQLVTLYTVSGAVAGSVLDASVGGSSFLAGTAIGAAMGAGAGMLHLQRRLAKATSLDGLSSRFRRAFSSEARVRVGPFKHPNFPFVLLDRALLHYDAVRTRAHARNSTEQGNLRLEGALATALDRSERQKLHRVFERLRKEGPDPKPGTLDALYKAIRARVRQVGQDEAA